MEDDSLDDFFAKKDKSKKKGKAKVTPGDILAKQEEKPKKKVKRKKEEKPTTGATESTEDSQEKDSTSAPKPKEEEEWADYEQEEKDYSGLRIQTLQIRDENSDDDNNQQGSGDEEGEEGEKGEGSRGPWNKGGAQIPTAAAVPKEEDTPPPEPKPAPEAPKEEAPSGPKKYVPPGARMAAQSAPSGPTPLRRGYGGKKNAPNIQSEEDFPTLGGAVPADMERNLSSFERVRGGGRQVEDSGSQGLKLQLGNKFASLGD